MTSQIPDLSLKVFLIKFPKYCDNFNSQVQERKVDEDQTSKSPPHNKISETPIVSAEQVSEPEVLTQVTQKLNYTSTQISTKVLKLTQNSFFQAQTSAKQAPNYEKRDLLPFFKAQTLPKHIQCFKKWQRLRCSDLSEILRITDQPTRRARALDLETYIHAMFPTEQYTVATFIA